MEKTGRWFGVLCFSILCGVFWLCGAERIFASEGTTGTGVTYTVSYDANGGDGAPSGQIKSELVDLTLSTIVPTKPGYTLHFDANGGGSNPDSEIRTPEFRCWNTDPSGTGTDYFPEGTYTLDQDVTLYAQWKDPVLGDVPLINREFYKFDGWYTSADEGTKVTSATIVTGDMTLYAHWTQITYKVTYHNAPGAPASQVKLAGRSLTLSPLIPTRFITVYYDANGGTCSRSSEDLSREFLGYTTSSMSSTIKYQPGDDYYLDADLDLWALWGSAYFGELPDVSRKGYMFDGWCYEDCEPMAYIPTITWIYTGAPARSGQYVKAHWTPDETEPEVKDISQARVSLSVGVYTYSMQECRPKVSVILDEAVLKENQDYTVSYSNNVNAGNAAATVTGTGNYTGKKDAAFTIRKADQEFSGLNSSYILKEGDTMNLSSAIVTAVLKSSSGNVTVVSTSEKTYSSSDGAVVEVDNNGLVKALKAGSASVTITDHGTDNLNAVSFTITVKVEKAGAADETGANPEKTPVGSCEVILENDSFKYTGKECKPDVSVACNGKTLVTGTDYTVLYLNNINAGTATVRVTGKGSYTGEKDISFTIRKKAQEITAKNLTLVSSSKKQTKKLGVKVLGGAKVTYTPSNKKIKVEKGKVIIPAKFIGLCKIKIKAASTQNYAGGSKTIKVTVNPPAVSLTGLSVSAEKKTFKISWKAVSGVTGYVVQRALDKKFRKSAEKVKVKTTSKEFSYTAGKIYYFRVRAYKKVSGKLYYSKWSKAQYWKAK